ncbi:bacterial Ig-like domain, group 2 [Peptostreptococcaceae bacterium AS15]|nr:bacterial Ig-like domain, group 2 [Peptostreptococcaceae bacterium AS15]
MLRKKALAFALAFALVLPMAYVPTTSYADTVVVSQSEQGKVVKAEGITVITDEFFNQYKDAEELYLSAPNKGSISNIGKLAEFRNLKTLSIKADNINGKDIKDVIYGLSNLTKIELKSRNFIDLGSVSNNVRQMSGHQKLEPIVQDVHLDKIIKKDEIDVPIKINGEAVSVSTDAMLAISTDALISVSTDPSLQIREIKGGIDNINPSKIKIKNYDKLVENGPVTLILSYNKTKNYQERSRSYKDVEFKGHIFLKLDQREFDVTVEGGSSDKISAKNGEEIKLNAPTLAGKKFVRWESNDDIVITNPTSSTNASFTMPNSDVKVTAKYEDYGKISDIRVTTDTMLMTTATTDVQLIISPDQYNDSITWTSSKANVATVDNKGTVTAKAKGETVITATTSLNKTASVIVKVVKEDLKEAKEEEQTPVGPTPPAPQPENPKEPPKPENNKDSENKQEPEKSQEPDKSKDPDKAKEPDKAQNPDKAKEPDKAKDSEKKSDSKDKDSKDSSNKNDKNSSSSSSGGGSSSSGKSSTSGGGGGGGGGSTSSKAKSEQKIAQIPSQAQTKDVKQEKVQNKVEEKLQTSKTQEEVSKEVKVSDKMTTKEAETKVNSLKDSDKITWSKEAVVKVVQKGIMQGNKGNFMPKKSVTRAEVAQVIANIIGEKAQTKVAVSDVNNNKWYAKAVQTVLENKIFTPDSKGNFRPQSDITRAELFVAIAKFKGVEPLNQTKAKEVLSKYKDVDSVPNWALGYVSALVEKGIVKGSNNKISVNDNLTREQLATIFANIVE